jgi:hypothetical protein
MVGVTELNLRVESSLLEGFILPFARLGEFDILIESELFISLKSGNKNASR